MKTMKNWFLKQGQQHKSRTQMINHLRYLVNPDKPAHRNTRIVPISDLNESHKNMLAEYDAYIDKKTAGKRPIAATNYILSMPEDLIHPTDEQWKEIYENTIENFCQLINDNQARKEAKGYDHIKSEKNKADAMRYNAIRLDPETFKKNSFCALHNEEANHEKASHIHILTSNIQNGEYLKMLNQTAGQNYIKKAYDKAVLNVLKLKSADYTPKCDRVQNSLENKIADKIDEENFQKRKKAGKTKANKRKSRRRVNKTNYQLNAEKQQVIDELKSDEVKNDVINDIKKDERPGVIKSLKKEHKQAVVNKLAKKYKQPVIKKLESKQTALNADIEDLKATKEATQNAVYKLARSKTMKDNISKAEVMSGDNVEFYRNVKKAFEPLNRILQEVLQAFETALPTGFIKNDIEERERKKKIAEIKPSNKPVEPVDDYDYNFEEDTLEDLKLETEKPSNKPDKPEKDNMGKRIRNWFK